LGPYLAYGILGSANDKYTYTYRGETESDSESIDAFGDPDDEDNLGLNRFDAGLSFGTGINFGKIYLGIQYDLGLQNIIDWDDDDDDFLKTRTFSINVGYKF
jgi:hypothetical protein